jgi:tetratricopeptide (TPR) repeat protein
MRYYRSVVSRLFVVAVLAGAATAFADAKLDSLVNAGKYADAVAYAEKSIPATDRTVDDWLNLANALERTDAPMEKVNSYLQAAQKANPSEPRVYLAFGIYSFKSKKYPDALKHFQKSYILQRTAKAAEGIALCAANLEKWDMARDAAESAVNLDPNTFESRLILANLYMKDKNYKSAVEQLSQIVKRKPGEVSFWRQLAECYEAMKMPDELATADEKIVELDKKDVKARERLAAHLMAKKDADRALALYKELAILTPNNASVFKNLYEISGAKNNKRDAILYLKNYLMLDSSSAESQKALADMLYEDKKIDEALEGYRKALRIQPAIKGIYKNYVSIVVEKKNEKEAQKVIPLAIKAGEADSKAYIALGDIYKKQKNWANAIKMYQEALKTETSNVAVLTSLGECQAAGGDAKGAITTYEQVVMLNPKAVDEQKTLGDLYMALKREDSGIKAYKEYLAKAPNDQKVAMKVGLAEYGKKNYKEAVKYLTMVKDGALMDVEYLAALGMCYFETGEHKNAADFLAKVQLKKPSAVVQKQTLKPLAQSYEKAGDAEKAADAYAAYTKVPGVKDPEASYKAAFLIEKSNQAGAIKAYTTNTVGFPQDPRSFVRLGLIYAEKKATHPQAAAMLKKASMLVDTLPDVWETMGEVYIKMGEKDSELAAYQKLLKLQPQHPVANKRVGTILVEKKQYSQGISNLEMALTMQANDVDVIMLLAEAYLATKRPAQAAELLEKAKAIKKDDVKLREQLYALHKETNQAKKAEGELLGLITLTKENKYRLMYSNDLIEEKRYEEAAKILKDVMVADPENVNCLMLLGQVQQAQSKFGEAIETYKTVQYIKGPYAPALAARGNVYLAQKDLGNAKLYFGKAVEADAKHALAYLGLARLAKAENNSAEYTKQLNKAKLLDPKSKEIQAEAAGSPK